MDYKRMVFLNLYCGLVHTHTSDKIALFPRLNRLLGS